MSPEEKRRARLALQAQIIHTLAPYLPRAEPLSEATSDLAREHEAHALTPQPGADATEDAVERPSSSDKLFSPSPDMFAADWWIVQGARTAGFSPMVAHAAGGTVTNFTSKLGREQVHWLSAGNVITFKLLASGSTALRDVILEISPADRVDVLTFQTTTNALRRGYRCTTPFDPKKTAWTYRIRYTRV